MLYGTTELGGAHGTVYVVSPSGAFTTLYGFNNTDGSLPFGALVQAADGNLYGTTWFGGANDAGTVFRITLTGTLTTLHSFDNSDGSQPYGALVQGTDGNLYGMTSKGGTNAEGTIFQITPGGTLTTLHSFDGTDGSEPLGGLVQGTDGKFYGTTGFGGSAGAGTIFSLSMGLGPFVKTLPTFGKVGSTITILGSDFTGTTTVRFNGTPAAFKILSSTAITATVPSGATTGTAQVLARIGTLSSNVAFQLLDSGE